MRRSKAKGKRQKIVAGGQWSVAGVLLFLLTANCLLLTAVGQTGGPYDLTHSVIAGGGGSASTGGTFNISGTAGQHAAGTSSASTPPQFDLHGGFWFQNLTPTAAGVTVSGRVTTPDGRGLRNAAVTMTDARGVTRSAVTSSFGYYRFEGVPVGDSFVMSVNSRNFRFVPRVVLVTDTLTDVDFVGLE